MQTNQLESLLDRLCHGDADAAEQVFIEYEPLLRIVVRRMLPSRLRSKFDSSDVVQSVWGDLLSGFRQSGWRFATADHLKAFLVKATRNRFLARQRNYQKQIALEESSDEERLFEVADGNASEPFEHVQSEEVWELILAKCSPAHRQLVELRRDGFTLADIASKTGYHPSSVRRIFYDLSDRVKDLLQ